jgi:hypothetical protein
MSAQVRSRFRVVAAIVAAAAQIVLCSASLVETRFGPDARAHIESTGTRLHHAHNDADCAACTGRHLIASSQLENPDPFTFSRSAAAQPFNAKAATWTSPRSDSRSRAPPVLPG